MSRSKQSRKVGAGALLGLTAVALVGSAHAATIVYSNETFEGGTPNYSLDGRFNLGGSDPNSAWDPLQSGGVDITPTVALMNTGYDSGSGSRNGVVANGDPTDSANVNAPSGQHGFVSTSSNRIFTSNYDLTLASDGIAQLNISLDYMFYALTAGDGSVFPTRGSAIVSYSANGLFDDTVQLYSFGLGEPDSEVVTPDHLASGEEIWQSTSFSVTEAGAGITFTDTAQLRINRVALVNANRPAGDTTNTNHVTFLDDIVVSAETIPEPTTAALLGLAGFALLRRRRK